MQFQSHRTSPHEASHSKTGPTPLTCFRVTNSQTRRQSGPEKRGDAFYSSEYSCVAHGDGDVSVERPRLVVPERTRSEAFDATRRSACRSSGVPYADQRTDESTDGRGHGCENASSFCFECEWGIKERKPAPRRRVENGEIRPET